LKLGRYVVRENVGLEVGKNVGVLEVGQAVGVFG